MRQILALSLLLAGCRSDLAAGLQAQPGAVLYQDDFSDPLSGWPRMAAGAGALDYSDGAYRMVVHVKNSSRMLSVN